MLFGQPVNGSVWHQCRADAHCRGGVVIIVTNDVGNLRHADKPVVRAEKNGVDQAGKDVGVNVQFIATNVTGPGMAQAIQDAISQHAAGIAVHDWFPSAEDPEIHKAIAAGIPVVEVDAAGPNWQTNGVLGFIGQTDQEAGLTGAQRLLAAGVKHALFVNHAPGAVNLDTRWNAFDPAMRAAGATATELNIPFSDSTNPQAVTQDIKGALTANPSVDGVFTNGASIAEDASRRSSKPASAPR